MSLSALIAEVPEKRSCLRSNTGRCRRKGVSRIEANAEAVADNLEEAADNVTSEAAEANLGNTAEAVRAIGKNQAEDMRTHDADTNLKNGI